MSRIVVSNSNFLDMFNGIIDDMLNDVHKRQNGGLDAFVSKESYPRLNISEDDDRAYIEATVPGLKKSEVTVDYKDGQISISGEASSKNEKSGGSSLLKEIRQSKFSRCISVDESIYDPKTINASLEDGILSVSIDRKQEAKPQKPLKISVK